MNNNKCKKCGGFLAFDPDSKKLLCENCQNTEEIVQQNSNSASSFLTPTSEGQKKSEKVVQQTCQTCGTTHTKIDGGELKRCPACGSKTLSSSTNISFVPDGILPFLLTREKASLHFSKWIKKRPFAPNDLIKLIKLKKMTGFYFPVWTMSFDVKTTFHGDLVFERTTKDGRIVTRNRPIDGERTDSFFNKTKNASSGIKKRFGQDFGTFDINNIKVYNSAYLFGFSSVENDISLQETTKEVKEDAEKEIKKTIEKEFEGKEIQNLATNFSYTNMRYNLNLLPVWATYYTYKNKHYQCYINGRTGKATGVAPKSGIKILFLLAGIAGLIALGGWIFGLF